MSHLSERDVLAKTIYAEARDQGTVGQEAVGHVIKNRASENRPGFGGNSIKDVCLQPRQFECWNDKKDIPINERDAYKQCQTVADSVLNGTSRDPTGGANHYNNPKKEPDVSWPGNCKVLGDIGDHRFYTDHK